MGRISIPRRPEDVKVPDHILKSVVFLAERAHSGVDRECFDLKGTGFFFGVPSPHMSGHLYLYLVTARHVAEKLHGE